MEGRGGGEAQGVADPKNNVCYVWKSMKRNSIAMVSLKAAYPEGIRTRVSRS
jgi:hypothetical protein